MARTKPTEVTTGSIGAESTYVPFTPDELRCLARGYVAGQVFGSWQLGPHDSNLLTNIFMPLIAIDPLTYKEWKRDGITHFIGDMKDSISMGINGYPIFTSMRAVTTADAERLIRMAAAMNDALDVLPEPEIEA